MDFFDDDDDAPSSDQPTRESRRIGEPEPEAEAEAPPPKAARRSRPAPRSRTRRGSRGFDDAPVPADGPGRPSRQQIRSRQLTLLGIAIVILILLFLAFRGCLDAREERSYKNYVSDLDALTVETKQVSDEVFGALTGDSGSDVALGTEINGARGTMAGLTGRAQGLDAPDDISGAQTQIALSYQMRQDALDVIAEEIPNAQGDAGSKKAAEKIEEQMRVLLASDVLFSRAQFEIEQALTAQEIVVEEGVPDSQFLPDTPNWLELSTVEAAIAGAGGGSSSLADCDEDKVTGTHGLALSSTTALPEEIVLQPDGAVNTVTADGAEFEIAVENQGDSPESDINVTMDGDLTGSQTISSIEPAEIATVTIPPKPAPKSGDTASITVTVATVCGEQVDSNNESTYEITFG